MCLFIWCSLQKQKEDTTAVGYVIDQSKVLAYVVRYGIFRVLFSYYYVLDQVTKK